MDQPIYITESQPLTWSPLAPPLTFHTQENQWRMGKEFKLQYLRATTEEGPTRVARDAKGRIYYRPHWPKFTALLDATTEAQIEKAVKSLASLPATSTAPELGFSSPLAIHLVMRQSPSVNQSNRRWESEGPFLSYWTKLPRKEKAACQTLRLDDWGLLDLAFRQRQFMVAEELWGHGHRFDQRLAEGGAPTWALTEGLTNDIPSLEDVQKQYNTAKAKRFLARIAKEEREQGMPQPEKLSDLGTIHAGFAALTNRWLRRMCEQGVNFNATIEVVEKLAESEAGEGRRAHRTAFMQSMVYPAGNWGLEKIMAQTWASWMDVGGYDFERDVVDPFVLKSNQPDNLLNYAHALGGQGFQCEMVESIMRRRSEQRLTQRLNEPQTNRPKPRL